MTLPSWLLVVAGVSLVPLIGFFGRAGGDGAKATELAPTSHTARGEHSEIATFAAG